MSDPRQVAYDTVDRVIRENAGKHNGDHWQDRDPRLDMLKAIRHLTTALLILDGHTQPDGEDHLALGLTRAAMAKTHS